MSQFNEGNSKGWVATAALGEGVIVKLGTPSGGVTPVVVATAATDAIVGVNMNAVVAGETASIKLRSGSGTVKVKLGGTVTIGAKLTTNATGLGIATTTAGNEIIGMALEAGVAGDFIEVMCAHDRY